ncbi:MAG: hypothetical protein IPN15_20010 [Saprospiraceae bacterium]|nr:hypothetical protein [Candidatus Vicinibacter affinis]
MWFKLLEINTDEKSVEETPFLYHQADEKWNSQSGLKYCGWSSVYTRKSDQNNSKAPANSNETWDPHAQKRKDLGISSSKYPRSPWNSSWSQCRVCTSSLSN